MFRTFRQLHEGGFRTAKHFVLRSNIIAWAWWLIDYFDKHWWDYAYLNSANGLEVDKFVVHKLNGSGVRVTGNQGILEAMKTQEGVEQTQIGCDPWKPWSSVNTYVCRTKEDARCLKIVHDSLDSTQTHHKLAHDVRRKERSVMPSRPTKANFNIHVTNSL